MNAGKQGLLNKCWVSAVFLSRIMIFTINLQIFISVFLFYQLSKVSWLGLWRLLPAFWMLKWDKHWLARCRIGFYILTTLENQSYRYSRHRCMVFHLGWAMDHIYIHCLKTWHNAKSVVNLGDVCDFLCRFVADVLLRILEQNMLMYNKKWMHLKSTVGKICSRFTAFKLQNPQLQIYCILSSHWEISIFRFTLCLIL